MTLAELLAIAVRALEAEGIPYMLTGSLASSFHGEPRSTRDIDFVIDPDPAALDRLVARLAAEDMYVHADAARDALAARGQFNAVAGDAKIDFMVRKDRPFSISEFGRRQRVRLPDSEADIVSLEDLIIAKLAWAAETGSDRQKRDVMGMIEVAGSDLDRAYVERWTTQLGMVEAWREVDRAGDSR
ncbi:MAG TPA: hypothetical protein VM451_02610 [Candidatus Limnocylindria bacterium]|nr:hypothetical protein [Candidatus Limnocylindria bacterium]